MFEGFAEDTAFPAPFLTSNLVQHHSAVLPSLPLCARSEHKIRIPFLIFPCVGFILYPSVAQHLYNAPLHTFLPGDINQELHDGNVLQGTVLCENVLASTVFLVNR